MTPFVMGNVLDFDFEQIWKEKAKDCWHDLRVEKYIAAYEEESSSNTYIKNYVDSDIML